MNILDVSNIVAGYGKTEILHGISIHIKEDEIVTIIGPNGAGKSTLLKAIMGYISIFSGDIFWKGNDITDLSPMRRSIKALPMFLNLGMYFPL